MARIVNRLLKRREMLEKQGGLRRECQMSVWGFPWEIGQGLGFTCAGQESTKLHRVWLMRD